LLTLIRHGQAGSRTAYDDLSHIGGEQSAALGRWLRESHHWFERIVTGGLERQKKTAAEILCKAGFSMEVEVDSRWSEFDLDAVYAALGPLLARQDEQFRSEYEQLQRDIADPNSSAHRAWRNCDVTLVRAWIEEKFEFDGESFSAFRSRIRGAVDSVADARRTLVVTSATPIALCASFALDLSARRVMQLAGALRNTSFTEIDIRPDGLRLVSFNNVPHLSDTRLHTFR
jgi:broad specificity phosphatase PhoE